MSLIGRIKKLIPPGLRAYIRKTLEIAPPEMRPGELVNAPTAANAPARNVVSGLPIAQQILLDYPVKSVPRYGSGKPAHPILYNILNRNRNRYQTELKNAIRLKEYFANISVTDPGKPEEPFWYNGWLPTMDGVAIYYFLVQNKPEHYLEIGSGNSTKFARRAIRDHNLPTKITSVDPQPRAEIDQICDKVIRQPLEDVDLAIFNELEKGDILFIDGSHRCFMNSDATVAFIDVLPRLNPGVFVEIHDIFLPYDYPASWDELYYTEQYLLAAYLLAEGKKIDPVMPMAFIGNDPELSLIFTPLWDDPRMKGAEHHGVSFWLETT
jgi:hypothetical protein